MAQLKKETCARALDLADFTSILRRGQYRGQILREARTRQNLIASGSLRLNSKTSLYVRQEADHANVLPRLPQLFNCRDGLVPRVQVHDDQFWLVRHQSHQGFAIRRHFYFHAKLLGGFRQFHLEEQIVHKRHDSSHFPPPLLTRFAPSALIVSDHPSPRRWLPVKMKVR